MPSAGDASVGDSGGGRGVGALHLREVASGFGAGFHPSLLTRVFQTAVLRFEVLRYIVMSRCVACVLTGRCNFFGLSPKRER